VLLNGRDERCGSLAAPHQPWLLRSNPNDASGSSGGYQISPLFCDNSSALFRPTVVAGTVLDCAAVSPCCPNEDWLGSSASGSERGSCRAGSRSAVSNCDSRTAKRCSRTTIAFPNWRPRTATRVFCPWSLATRSASSRVLNLSCHSSTLCLKWSTCCFPFFRHFLDRSNLC